MKFDKYSPGPIRWVHWKEAAFLPFCGTPTAELWNSILNLSVALSACEVKPCSQHMKCIELSWTHTLLWDCSHWSSRTLVWSRRSRSRTGVGALCTLNSLIRKQSQTKEVFDQGAGRSLYPHQHVFRTRVSSVYVLWTEPYAYVISAIRCR